MSIAAFDIDGVVADVGHRVHHVAQRPKNWDRFFAEAAADPVLAEGASRVRAAATEHDIVWLTGRPARLAWVTASWLAQHGLPAGELIMRARQDYRPASVLKVAALRELAGRGIAMFLDDDPQVVGVASAAGFPATLASWVERSPALSDAQERAGRS